ncbi:ATP-binding response regulator [Azospirillum sp. sgz302134]
MSRALGEELDDEPLFGPGDETLDDSAQPARVAEPWPILVVDDDPQVHTMTEVLLRDFEFEGRPFEVISALSAAAARSVLAVRPDIPVALLDVVMETDDAGLRLVRFIREDLGNRRMRIVLRTGQPGQAPERDVVVAYDINDYKSKSELTAQRLYTTLVSALRAWRDIVTIERHRQGLERILSASAPLFETRSMRALVEELVDQLSKVVDNGGGAVLACRMVDRGDGKGRATVVSGSGRFARLIGKPAAGALPPDLAAIVIDAFETQRSAFGADRCILAFRTREHGTTVFALERPEPYGEDDHRMLELFCHRVSIGFDNVCLYEDMVALNQSLERRVEARTAELAANQAALVAAKERVERALDAELTARERQRQFVTMVSHEFRTPLAIIDSAAQMLALRAERVDPEALDRLRVIRSSVQRLTGLIDQHMTDERLQVGTLPVQKAAVDPGALLRSVVEPFRAAYPGCDLRLDLDGLPPVLMADGHLLAMLFGNLLNNALKYSDPDCVVSIQGRADGDMVELSVADQGRGIPENELSLLFDRHYRGSGSAGVPGTGIGLHTVQQIVLLHGGSIAVDSAVGRGSTFRVRLPIGI